MTTDSYLNKLDPAELKWCRARAARMHEMVQKEARPGDEVFAYMNDSAAAYGRETGAPPKTPSLHVVVSDVYISAIELPDDLKETKP